MSNKSYPHGVFELPLTAYFFNKSSMYFFIVMDASLSLNLNVIPK